MNPAPRVWLTDALMLLTAAIWGSTFVAQQMGMDSVGPFAYTAARLTLGLLLIAPLWRWRGGPFAAIPVLDSTGLWRDGALLGLVLFVAINLQQVGLLGTSVSNAGFITGLYVVLVPLLLALFGRRVGLPVWLAVALATAGLYFLSVKPDATIAPGDWLQLGSAAVWAVHVLLVGCYARRHDALRLSLVQYLVAAALSWAVALARAEPMGPAALWAAAGAIAWGGILSIGVAYTLQVIAQRHAHPTHAAIIYSSEGVFSALGGWWVLGEAIGWRGWGGAALIVAGMLVAQLGRRD
ncbi:EamA-like transporter family protein [Tepidimonas alkaliphilus]|uniref:EamA-like transporter family protein n=1 Tax=Tepidimonas alkaliphilus TaxID=2588942 RepID=A0A554WCY7_9BURK|nr:DMT family transporter [Tepidimonas alkaliphilus]TSE21433.1 EamA-like transporter family protein [Tepidimonas alkaliphilus]